MARSASVRVTGLREVQRELDDIRSGSADLPRAFDTIAEGITVEARAQVGVVTGELRATIRPATSANQAVVVAGSIEVDYAGIHNYVRPGNRFLTDPANDDPDSKVKEVESDLEDLIRKANIR